MVHYTIKHNDILRSKDGLIGVSEEAYPLLTPQGQRARQQYLRRRTTRASLKIAWS